FGETRPLFAANCKGNMGSRKRSGIHESIARVSKDYSNLTVRKRGIRMYYIAMLMTMLTLLVGLALVEIRAIVRRRRARAKQPAIYAVGSPEYNQQIIQTLAKVNERLASQGKRVPERAAIE